VALTLLAYPLLTSALFLQDPEWVEVRFHRVHLLNGNFIDGQLLKDTPGQVLLKVKSGEMGIRRDQIDFVEYIKMRSLNERPVVRPPPNNPGNPALPREKPATVNTPEEIRQKVDGILAKLKSSQQGRKRFPVEEMTELGADGAIYLATRLPDLTIEVQSMVAAALGTLKVPQTAPILEPLLGDPSPKLRATAAVALGLMGDEGGKVRYLRPLLRDPDPEVRSTVLGMLAAVEDRDWFDPVSQLCGDADPTVRSRAMAVSGRLAAKYSLQETYLGILADPLRRGGPDVRIDMAGAIGSLGRREGWSHLAPLLGDTEPKVRAAAAMALLALAAPDSGPDILDHLPREQDRMTRLYLASTAQKLKLRAAVVPLVDWLSDPDEEIRKAAGAALLNLTGQTFGQDRGKWTEWLEKSGLK
jgi:HEAT repeat protein